MKTSEGFLTEIFQESEIWEWKCTISKDSKFNVTRILIQISRKWKFEDINKYIFLYNIRLFRFVEFQRTCRKEINDSSACELKKSVSKGYSPGIRRKTFKISCCVKGISTPRTNDAQIGESILPKQNSCKFHVTRSFNREFLKDRAAHRSLKNPAESGILS